MKAWGLLLVLLFAIGISAQEREVQHPGKEPPMLGIHWARGAKPVRPGGNTVLMTWHNGSILTTTVTGAIYWGTSWSNPNFAGDKVTGLTDFYTDFNGSDYATTSDEYTGTNGQVSSATSHAGSWSDYSAGPASAPSVSTIVNKVCTVLAANGVSPASNGFYMVYTDLPRGHNGYCAWHSYGACGATPVQVAFSFNLDGDPGCDPQDTATGHSQGLAALANVTAHELSEARTDPRNGGWYDSSNGENGDKCAWTFNVSYVHFPTPLNSHSLWHIQGEWSNAAYKAGTGYANLSGQKGCLDGQ